MSAPTDPKSKSQLCKAICAAPQNWKVCLGCERVANAGQAICGRCGTYRFDACEKAVKAAARRELRRKEDF